MNIWRINIIKDVGERDMQRKIQMIKSLLLTIAASTVINWLFIIIFVIGLFFNWFTCESFVVIILFQWLELMLLDVNTHYYVVGEEVQYERENGTNETIN